MTRWFEAPLTTLAFCWRLDRRDGISLGLTSHDLPLVLGGMMYRAAPGMVPSALERTTGLDAASVQLSGAITSRAIREADLLAGRWDRARLRLWAVDWQAPDTDPVLLVRGHLGQVEISEDRFSVELIGAPAVLDQPATPTTSPYCRARLGDRRCRVDMAGRTLWAIAVQQLGHEVVLDRDVPDGVFVFGRLRWADGPLAGCTDQIIAQAGRQITLADPPALGWRGPVGIVLTQGCDRRLATCTTRFANAVNFRGEPHLPGNDLLLRYGG